MKASIIMFKLLKLVKPLMLNMIIAITLGLCGHLAASFITILAGYGLLGIIDFWSLVFILLILAILRAIFRYIEQASNHYIAFKLLALIRDKVFGALRKLAPAKLENKNAGNMINIITSDIELLEVFYAHTISPIMIALAFGIIMVIFIGNYHVGLGILALCSYITVGMIVPLLMNYLSNNKALIYRQFSGKLSSFVLESLRGIKEIIQYNSGNKRLNDLKELTIKLDNEENSLKKIMAFNISLCNVVVLLANMIMLFYGGYLFGHGLIDFEAYLISVLALFSSFGPFIALANLGSGLQNTIAAGKRTLDILEEKVEVEDIEGKHSCDFGTIEVNNINFSYDEELILKDLSLEVKPKSILGIVGKSGSGKSTLLKLLMRFWQVKDGSISINNRKIDDINTIDLRNMESYVTQDAHLFHDTLKNNLKIAKLDARDDEIINACKKANIHEFIMSLPKGYDTMVSELGSSLSSGEKQRIALARAFLHDGELLLLDEPTSNLDSLNEAIILNSLRKIKDRTLIMISHRKSTLKSCDKIIEIDSGRLS